jgi:hypothetical protein
MNDMLIIRTVQKLYQRTYDRNVTFHRSDFDDASWCWLFSALDKLRAQSELTPLPHETVVNQKKGLSLAAQLPEWAILLSLPAEDSSVAPVIALFRAMEDALIARVNRLYKADRISSCTRAFLLKNVYALRQDLAARVRKLFRTAISVRSEGRELISDMPQPGRPPLSALTHESYAELREASKQRVNEDLARIQAACSDVLDRYGKALEALNHLRRRRIGNKTEHRIRAKHLGIVNSQEALEPWSEEELTDYLSLRLKEMDGSIEPFRNEQYSKTLIHPRGAKVLLRRHLYRISNGAHIHDLLRLELAPPAEVLLACAMIIQIHTHWNFVSVLELEFEGIDVKNFPHRLQSVKPRTSDQTPIVFVERSDTLVLRAMQVLAARYQQLRGAKIIPESDKRLWFSSKSVVSGRPWPVVSWGGGVGDITRNYNLPPFSLEQLRVQCLAAVSMGERGLGAVTQTAGHVNAETSLRYVDKLLLRRLNAANSLEFENRLEATVRYMMNPSEPVPRNLIAYPLGDGASCQNPQSPPDARWLDAGICRTEQCHVNDGCPNRAILITEDRIEEVVRTKRYYLSNWQRLANENPIRFESVHMPQMLFSLALYGVLKRGPYRHRVAAHDSSEK